MRFSLSLLALSALASAQSSSSSSASSLIPSSASADCKSFLADLNSDTVLSNCVAPLLTATTSAANSNNSVALKSSLTKLCSTNGCSETFIRTRLANFYGNCSTELTSGTDDTVRNLYDLLYVVEPLRNVVCTKDETTKEYCVTALSANVTVTGSSDVNSTLTATNGTVSANGTFINAAVLHPSYFGPETIAAQYLSVSSLSSSTSLSKAKRASADSSTGTYPNSTTFKNTDLPYLFIQPTDSASVLCSSCAKGMFSTYAAYESRMPYALGLSSSAILGGQAALWQAAIETCGSTWVTGITNAATAEGDSTTSTSIISGAVERKAVWSGGALIGLVGGLVGFFLA